MSLLVVNSTPAERFRGCKFSETFENAQKVVENGGTLSGSPIIDSYAEFDGSTDSIEYALDGNEYYSDNLSIRVDFIPNFDYVDDIRAVICSSENNTTIVKQKNSGSNDLTIIISGTTIEGISSGVYGTYWLENQRNTLVVSGTTGNTSVWLNGNNILDSDSTAWTPMRDSTLTLGSSDGGATLFFDGKITKFQIYHCLLTAQEALDFYNEKTYDYTEQAELVLNMEMAQHDATNLRTLDSSVNEYHATFGDGSTPSTYPTKTTQKGYSFDGSADYLNSSNVLNITTGSFALSALVKFNNITGFQGIISRASDGGTVNYYLRNDDGKLEFYFRNAAETNNRQYQTTGDPLVPYKWIHVVFTHTWGDSGSTKMFVNGIEQASSWLSGGTEFPVDYDAYDLRFGQRDLTNHFLNGNICCASIWKKLITPLQAADMYINNLKRINDV